MLETLSVRNVALIERAELSFSAGLNVLSGETGAGKSVLLDCIDFVLGAKADREMVRTGADECLVQAQFTCNEPLAKALEELDIEADDSLVISRKLTKEGKGSIKVNGVSVTAAMLRSLTTRLVDVHGQSEHFYLLSEANQLRLLDEIAGDEGKRVKAKLKPLLDARKNCLNELQTIGSDEAERARRLDVLRFQIDEITRASLKTGEEEELEAFLSRYRNLEKLLSGYSTAMDFLRADGGCIDGLNGARRALGGIAKYDGACSEFEERLENASAELEDIADSLESMAESLDVDEREAERAEARYDEIKTLKKKYGGTVEAVLAFLERAQKDYDTLSNSAERFQALQVELEKLQNQIYNVCLELTAIRKKTAEGFTRRVTEELKTLNISSARFEIEFEDYAPSDALKATADGLGGVKFLFSANAGEPPRELNKIISGGEMSRFMLAVKAQLSDTDPIGTYVFDEIDAGIGGRTGHVVAEKFARISEKVQVLAVSHLAVVAAFADKQFLIEKHEEDARTQTKITALVGEARKKEIARLVGSDTGENALKFAEDLQKEAEIYKKSLSRK